MKKGQEAANVTLDKLSEGKGIKEMIICNAAAIVLVFVFIFIYIVSQNMEDAFLYFGATAVEFLNGEYYRWLTSLFLHANLRHLLANAIGLLSVGSLLSSFLKNRQVLFLFLSGGILSEAAFSVTLSEQIYDIGASSGIFALIACLIVCCLRFQEQVRIKWHRLDLILVFLYFAFANSSVSAFLVHVFGFAAGILISFVMVMSGLIKKPDDS